MSRWWLHTNLGRTADSALNEMKGQAMNLEQEIREILQDNFMFGPDSKLGDKAVSQLVRLIEQVKEKAFEDGWNTCQGAVIVPKRIELTNRKGGA